MTLNKRYPRSINSNRSFYISATVLTVATLFLFFMMNIAGNAILEFGDKFFAEQKVEDANFTTYMPIPDEEITKLENEYGIELETQYFVNVDTNGTTARVFKKTKEIDLYDITVGEDSSADDEVIISEGYAVNNKISVGDKIKIGEKSYTITGFFQRPDYLYMVENEDDAYKNITSFFHAYMTDSEFDTLGYANSLYLIRYNGNNDIEFRRHINENYFMRSYLSAKDNQRINMVDMQAEMFVLMSYIILCVMPLIAVALISIIISRKVKSEQKLIGTLTALGYTKGKLMRHYAGFALIPGLLGGIITVVLAAIFAQPFGELGLQDYEPMRIECHLNPIAAAIGIVIPTVMYVIAALFSVNRLLNKDTVLLLSSNSDTGRKRLKGILAGKKVSFRIKYAVRSLIGNPARTFVVFLGIFLGSYITLLGFSFIDAMDYTMNNGVDELGSYNYQYILNELVTDNSYGGEPLLMAQMENCDGKQISLMGTDSDNKYLHFIDTDGNKIDLDNGYYLTSVASMVLDVRKGDRIKLYNPLTLEEYEITVAGIIDNDMQCAILTNMAHTSEILGIDSSACNVLMSGEQLDIPESMVVQTIKKSDSGKQIQTMINQMGIMLYSVIGLGVIICIASVYVAVNMLVTENRINISMLKVLGYTDRKINSIVLRINHILLPIGILISIPAVYGCVGFFFQWMADFIGILIKSYISPTSYILTILLTGASYFGSLLIVKRKITQVDMVESLKDNRE